MILDRRVVEAVRVEVRVVVEVMGGGGSIIIIIVVIVDLGLGVRDGSIEVGVGARVGRRRVPRARSTSRLVNLMLEKRGGESNIDETC